MMSADRIRKILPHTGAIVTRLFYCGENTQAAERLVVRTLKDLCLTTSLVGNTIFCSVMKIH